MNFNEQDSKEQIIIPSMERFPNCAAQICLMSARGDMRGSADQKHKPLLT